LKIGIVYPQIELGGDPDAVRRIGLATEELGFSHLVVYDHVVGAEHADRDPKLWGPYTENDPFHDPFVMFGYLAGITKNIELVSGVLILPQRQTVLAAQQAADVDLLSGERLRLGVGIGWNYVEYHALGEDFATRGKRIDEQIGFLRRLWTEPLLSFEGEFDQIERGNINPRPKRQIPIWIGGFSEAAFRRGGTLGDGFIFAGNPDNARDGSSPIKDVLGGWDRVKHHLAENGRSVDGYGADYVTVGATSIDKVTDTLKRWEDAGGTHASVVTMGMELKTIEAHLDFMAEIRNKVG